MTNEAEKFVIDVVYALPTRQKVIQVKLAPGTSAIEAVRLSKMQSFFPEIDLATVKLGSFGNQIPHEHAMQPGQRVEIYRPLIADPKDVRRRRAEKAKDEGRANKVTGGRA